MQTHRAVGEMMREAMIVAAIVLATLAVVWLGALTVACVVHLLR